MAKAKPAKKQTKAQPASDSLVSNVLEELLRNRQDLLLKVVDILQGREAKARIDLNGVSFHLGETIVKMEGNIQFSVTPLSKRQ